MHNEVEVIYVRSLGDYQAHIKHWIKEHPDVKITHVTQVLGTHHRKEPELITTIFYHDRPLHEITP